MEETSARPGLRERQRQETTQAIRRAAFGLLRQESASAVSVQRICDAAGVSQRTFFNHFRSKDEALLPDLPEFDAESQAAFVAGHESDLVVALGRLLTRFAVRLTEEEDQMLGPATMRHLVHTNPELTPRAMAVFEAHERRVAELVGLRTGRDTDDLFCRVASLTASAAMRAAFLAWVEGAGDDPPGSLAGLETTMDQSFSIIHELATPH